MAGYTRSYNKSTGNTIEASDFNTEYQSIDDAFNATSGHTHNGSTDEGAYVPLISDSDNNNAIELDTVNNEIDFSVEVSTVKTRQLVIADGAFLPDTDNDIDLGSGTYGFKNFYLDGNITVGGTVDGRDVATDGTKLDGVEASADVTDATNVAAAGAVMDGDFSTNGVMKRTGAGTYTTATAPTGTIVGTSDAQTLTNKTIVDTSNSLTITASTVDNVPSGNLLATNVQSALNEIQTEIDGLVVTGGEPTTYEVLDGKGDVGTGSAQVAQGSHTHTGVYEPANPLLLETSDVDDVPINGATTAPVSSNWAFDHMVDTTTHGTTGSIVGTSDNQTLTTKTIALGSNTISGTFAQFNTAVTDATLVSTDNSVTLTNKAFGDGFATGGATNLGAESGSVTISTGDSGVTSASIGSDDLIIENDANTGISICSPNISYGYIRFADPEDNDVGALAYNHVDDSLRLRAGGVTNFNIDATNCTFGDGTTDALGAEAGSVTISTGNSGASSIGVGADDFIIENNSDAGLTILTPDTNICGINFGDTTSSNVGRITYNHNTNTINLYANSTNVVDITPTELKVLTGGVLLNNLGSSDVNTLDDYEEGTFTPTYTFTTAGDLTAGYTTQVGAYIKIGNMVMFTIYLNATPTYTTASGQLRINTLPFTPVNNSLQRYSVACSRFNPTTWTDAHIGGEIYPNATGLRMFFSGSGSGATEVSTAHLPSGSAFTIELTGTYITS